MKKSFILLGACLLLMGYLSQIEYASASRPSTVDGLTEQKRTTSKQEIQDGVMNKIDAPTTSGKTTEVTNTKTVNEQSKSASSTSKVMEATTELLAGKEGKATYLDALFSYINSTTVSISNQYVAKSMTLRNDFTELYVGSDNYTKYYGSSTDIPGTSYQFTGTLGIKINSVTPTAASKEYVSVVHRDGKFYATRTEKSADAMNVTFDIDYTYYLQDVSIKYYTSSGQVTLITYPMLEAAQQSTTVSHQLPDLAGLTGLTKFNTVNGNYWKEVLGTPVAEFSIKNGVSNRNNLSVGDSFLPESEFEFSMTNANYVFGDMIGEESVNIRATWTKNRDVYQEITVPVKIEWGNTLAIGGYTTTLGSRLSASFSLVDAENKRVLTAGVAESDDFQVVHSSFPGQKYFSIDRFDLSNASELALSEELNGIDHVEANGDTPRRNAINEWGTRSVNTGDIVRVWTREDKNYVYENEVQNSYTDGLNSVYYEILSSGFNPLDLNKLKTTTQNIKFGMTQSELDSSIDNYLNTGNYSNLDVVKFTKYPDTSASGTTEGKIQVSETLNSGKKVTYEYTVPFTVTGELKATVATDAKITTTLGADSSKLSTDNLIETVTLDGKEVTSDNYTLEITNASSIYTDTVLARSAKIKVTLKSDTTRTTEVSVPVEIKWGDTLAAGGFDGSDRISNTFSLVNQNGLSIIAGLGNRDDSGVVHTYFPDTTYYTFDWWDASAEANDIQLTDTTNGTKH